MTIFFIQEKNEMNIALVGHGKMGRMIENMAAAYDIRVTAVFDIDTPLRESDTVREMVAETDVLVDFSVPMAAADNIRTAAALKKNMVIGTTGWSSQLSEIEKTITASGTALVYGSNFSLGVNLFYKIIEYTGKILSAAGTYDPYLVESHHKQKKDSPSGTALNLAALLKDSMQEREIPVSSIRAGYIPGIHEIGFDSRADTIRLIHSARSREGFADGALQAARWISGKTGIHTFSDVLDDLFFT